MPEGPNTTKQEGKVKDNGSEVSVGQEKTVKKQLEESLVKNEELEEKNRDLRRLFRTLGHDLRGPIASIIGIGRYLSEKTEDNKIIDILKTHDKLGEDIVELIQEISDWSQEEELNPELSIINLSCQVKKIIDLLNQQANEKKIELKNEIPEEVNIFSNPKMIKIIVRNLISNAIKFTKENGHVFISCEEKGNTIEIRVADDGIGISEEKKNKLLNELLGKSNKGTNNESGTGFGLSLCMEFMKKMKGTLSVESEEGKGSTFIVTLPVGNQEGGE
ncbi:MAG: HAMP domain-containing sensor histidine kinase [Candidatus Paceibacterota bacterium]